MRLTREEMEGMKNKARDDYNVIYTMHVDGEETWTNIFESCYFSEKRVTLSTYSMSTKDNDIERLLFISGLDYREVGELTYLIECKSISDIEKVIKCITVWFQISITWEWNKENFNRFFA